MKFQKDILNCFQVREQTQFYDKVQREMTGKRNATIEVISSKIYKAKLWFLCMTHRLIVLYNCIKFYLNSFNGCQLTERTQNSIANDQREITPEISKAELLFFCMTYCLIVLYKCMKFQPNSFNSVQLTERTRNCLYLCYKGNNLKNIHARVMVLEHDMSSQCALQSYEVSLKYL